MDTLVPITWNDYREFCKKFEKWLNPYVEELFRDNADLCIKLEGLELNQLILVMGPRERTVEFVEFIDGLSEWKCISFHKDEIRIERIE